MKIYIMGSTGSGKTYLSNKLSKKYKIRPYELDRIVYDQKNLTVHRKDKEIQKDFEKIIQSKDWIIEDIGRKRFIKGRELCDKIYYIKISKFKTYLQMLKRWSNQRKGIELYNMKPTIKNLFKQLNDVRIYKREESKILKELEEYKDKLIILDKATSDFV